MSLKLTDLTREDLEKLVAEHQLKPGLKSQNPYLASGPECEIMAIQKPDGLYEVQLLDKKQVEKSVENTIRVFQEFAKGAKS